MTETTEKRLRVLEHFARLVDADLWGLLAMARGGGDVTTDYVPATVTKPAIYRAPETYEIPSETRANVDYYVVRHPDAHWTCTCPDFIERRAKRGEWCKHIYTANNEREGQIAVKGY